MPNQLRNLDVQYVSLVDRAAVRDPSNPTEPQRFLLWKSAGGPADTNGGDMPDTPTAEELSAALKKAEEERDAAIERAEKAEGELAKKDDEPKTEPETATIDKSDLSPEIRAALEKAETETAEIRKRAEAAEELAKAERDQRVTKEFVDLAKSEFPHLGSADNLGPRLKRMSESLSKEDYDAHIEELRAANAQIDTGNLFAELGKSGDPAPEGSGSGQLADLQRKAEELRKSDSNLSEYEALERVLRQDREAQARLVNASR